MKKYVLGFLLISSLAAVQSVLGAQNILTGFGTGFTAPNVSDKSNIPTPFNGDILLDTSDATFYGYSGSAWVPFGGASSVTPPGVILPYGGTTAPTGYVLCDGSSLDRTTYASLFAVLDTAYGAVDSTHFNVPDLRGRFLRGLDGAAGRDPNSAARTAMAMGGNSGNNIGSVQTDAFQNITGTFSGVTNAPFASSVSTSGALSAIAGNTQRPSFVGISGSWSSGFNFDASTSPSARTSTETRPINAYVNYIIKI